MCFHSHTRTRQPCASAHTHAPYNTSTTFSTHQNILIDVRHAHRSIYAAHWHYAKFSAPGAAHDLEQYEQQHVAIIPDYKSRTQKQLLYNTFFKFI